MVRVGGGWVALDEFLVKNDPCRGKCRVKWHLLFFYFSISVSMIQTKRKPTEKTGIFTMLFLSAVVVCPKNKKLYTLHFGVSSQLKTTDRNDNVDHEQKKTSRSLNRLKYWLFFFLLTNSIRSFNQIPNLRTNPNPFILHLIVLFFYFSVVWFIRNRVCPLSIILGLTERSLHVT